MPAPAPFLAIGDLVLRLLSGSGPDRALDALLHALRETPDLAALRGGIAVAAAETLAAAGSVPAYTAAAAAARAACRGRGMVAASGRGAQGAWASVWLPPPHGDTPVLMYADDEARAAAAAFAEATGILVGMTRRGRPLRAAEGA